MFRKRIKKKKKVLLPVLDRKAQYLASGRHRTRRLKRWYKTRRRDLCFRLRIRRLVRFLVGLRIPGQIPSAIRWVIVDFLRAKPRKFWGIYQFVALPGEGKNPVHGGSDGAHPERAGPG